MQQESILIVDDETLNLQVLRQLLMPQFQIKACKSDKAAFRIRSDAPLPGLILLDSRMHEMDGEKTHAAIKQNQAFKEVRC
jgi:putative two-component system response regulator